MILELPDIYSALPAIGSMLFFLYAEIHFRFPGIPSLYFRKQPEIIADVPHRIGPGQKLPVLLLVKDAHRFPVKLRQLSIDMVHHNQCYRALDEPLFTRVATEYHEWVYFVDIPESFRGLNIRVNVTLQCEIAGKPVTIKNDNYPMTSHAPFRVMIDPHPLPKKDNWYYGDLHCHSNFTSDQVEFGASVPATVEIARCMGLDFAAITDHSYDLDDEPDNYLKNDPLLTKWHAFQNKVATTNARIDDFTVIPGEELSAGNANNRNVHFLLLNSRVFFEGAGDSFEDPLRVKPRWQVRNVLQLLQPNALAIAAHPENRPPISQRIIINRGKWLDEDYHAQGLHGVQMWNGDKSHFIKHGLKKWTDLLLSGKRLTLVAGNDAHGNFNRFRQLSIPFVCMAPEHDKEVFGQAKTVVKIDSDKATVQTIIDAIKKGRVMVTDGPFAEIELESGEQKAGIGDTLRGKTAKLNIHTESTPFFGEIDTVTAFIGDIEKRFETRLDIPVHPDNTDKYSQDLQVEIDDLPVSGYVRLQVTSKTRDRVLHGFTNPVYMEQ